MLEQTELIYGSTWLICNCKLKFGLFSNAKFNSIIIYCLVDLLLEQEHISSVCCSFSVIFVFYRRWFFNHSAGNLHGERMYSSEYSGLLWQLPLVWPKHIWFVWVMSCLETLFTGSGFLPFCLFQSNFWSVWFLLKISPYLQISQWANGVKTYMSVIYKTWNVKGLN